MNTLTKFLITYVGVKMKDNVGNPNEPGFITVIKHCSVDCLDDIAAEEYAQLNVDTFLYPDKGFAERTWRVRDYVALASLESTRDEADEVVRNNLTEQLDPIVDGFLHEFWINNQQRHFMESCLKTKLNNARNDKDRAGIKAKYLTQVCSKQCEVELRIFHRKVTEQYLENQIFNRIFRFLCPEQSLAVHPEEGIPTSAKQ